MPIEPSENEEQYFKAQELTRRLERAAKEQRQAAVEEMRRLKELHWMRCPKCGQPLMIEQYGTVEIDVCPGCKGLWLDANELEQVLANTQKAGPLRSFLRILGKE